MNDTTPPPDLMSFARQVHSSADEDGVLLELFRRLGVERGVFCEFGAWDGVAYSNCRVFFEAGWSGVFIEPDAARFRRLRANYADAADRVLVLDAFIRRAGENSLDEIFRRNGVTRLDLLSIDIDGDDLAIWRSLTVLRPVVVVIEYSYSVPFDVRYENPEGCRHSSGALSILEHAESVGYDFVGFAGQNLIFCDRAVRPEAVPVVERARFFEEGMKDRIFAVYDGTILRQTRDGRVVSDELIGLPHVGCYMFQPVPRFLRGFDDVGRLMRWRRRFMVLQAFLLRPLAVLATVPRLWTKILSRRRRR
ncbi:MAG: FkbM family methyltransferase [Alphaproteobacteria bacterium]|nr:FkbM family methyltransferase [Alphaproteobacteria bacterium]MDA8003933.1 FkbM family methyltransferase [Alphaproteobacteria bacterium]MDA8005257.1 FkbM family methyltransferase [Alphaproteobacteria bacterium]MDA8013315.1 FkbM family methyltransferase [Alphaproteobacteria bacterium]